MATLQFTAVHVRGLLDLSRTDLHRWLTLLPPFNQAPTQARTARHFTISDLAFFSLVALLHRRLGLPVPVIARFSELLYEHVSRPSSLSTPMARIFLNQIGGDAWEISPEAKGSLSISIDPEPVWDAVYQFIGLSTPAQRELTLGLIAVPPVPLKERDHGRRAS